MASRKTSSTPAEREKRLIRACKIANQDPELREIEREFDSLEDAIPEPWDGTPAA
jgi:hypothetical protein